MKNKNLYFFLVFVVMCFLTAHRGLLTSTQPSSGLSLAAAMKTYVSKYKKPPVPSTSKQYTVLQLMNLINTKNPAKNSTFHVLIDTNSVTTGKYTANPSKAHGSKAVNRIPELQKILESSMNTTVTLHEDPALIDTLYKGIVDSMGRKNIYLDDANKANYQRILLYFELGGYRIYINDPFPPAGKNYSVPAKDGTTTIKRSFPVDDIINKWDFTKTAESAMLQ